MKVVYMLVSVGMCVSVSFLGSVIRRKTEAAVVSCTSGINLHGKLKEHRICMCVRVLRKDDFVVVDGWAASGVCKAPPYFLFLILVGFRGLALLVRDGG